MREIERRETETESQRERENHVDWSLFLMRGTFELQWSSSKVKTRQWRGAKMNARPAAAWVAVSRHRWLLVTPTSATISPVGHTHEAKL